MTPVGRRETWIVLINVAFWIFLGYYLATSQRYLQDGYAEGAFTLLGLNLLLALGAILSIGSLAFFWAWSRRTRRG